MKLLLLLLLLGHTLGDFYLQTQSMADRKEYEPETLLRHGLVYGLPFAGIAGLFGFSQAIVLAGGLAVVLHGLIDFAKARLVGAPSRGKRGPGRSAGRIYLLDQGAHWLSLFAIAFYLRDGGAGLAPLPVLVQLAGELGGTWQTALRWSLALLLINRPSNITFVKLFSLYKPEEEAETARPTSPDSFRKKERLKAGGIIGSLEKLAGLIFLARGEAMAIGLILTAKSIARYDRISKSASFAEYYLIGTLTSLIMVLLIHFLCFSLLGQGT